jgi:hypothetical protein
MHYQDMAAKDNKARPALFGGRPFSSSELMWLMTHIANLRTPNEWPERKLIDVYRDLRRWTEKYWPGLWKAVKENETDEETKSRALNVVVRMREYLRLFWREPDPRARDWYIHRAREYYQRHFVLPQSNDIRETFEKASTAEDARKWAGWLNIEIERLLDQPPQRNGIEDALFELQERARYSSKSPLYCKNPNCEKPFFLSEKKGTKFCSPKCSQAGIMASKRKSWSLNKTKWRSK